jgi:multidrug efflux system membrane fusion protein
MPIENSVSHTEAEEPAIVEEPSSKTRPSRLRAGLVVLAVLIVAGLVIWRILASQATDEGARNTGAPGNRPVPVQVAEVQQRTMPIYFTALGTVTAYNTVTVKSRVDGQIVKINFREGQEVKKGSFLLEIDPQPYEAALAQAEGQYARDEANAVNAKAEAARYAALLDAEVVSKEVEQSEEAAYGQAEGALKADEAAIQAARVNVAYTRIMSPIDGQVGLRQVDIGNIVHATDTTGLVVVTQLQPISVIFTLPEEQLPEVRQRLLKGEKLQVDAYDRSETTKLASGSLLTVDNQIDTTTGMDKLKAVFANQDQGLFPNQFVNVRLILENRPDVIVVPASALQTGSNGTFVYVMKKDHTVEARNIVTTITEGSLMLVDKGLKKGEQVVVDGQEKLRAGSKVIPSGGGKAGGKNAGSGHGSGNGDAGSEPGAADGSGAKGKGDKGAGKHKADAVGGDAHGHKAKSGQTP